jgi:iron-sulfur cluster assembly accessory protein
VGVRLGVKTTGCSGLAYKLEYADEVAPEDIVFEGTASRCWSIPKSLPYIDGTELDFVREGLNEGFKFHNPREKDRCGCGSPSASEAPVARTAVGFADNVGPRSSARRLGPRLFVVSACRCLLIPPSLIRPERADRPEVVALLDALDAYLGSLYAPEDNHILDVAALLAPDVDFLVAELDGRLVGCGATRRMPGERTPPANRMARSSACSCAPRGGVASPSRCSARWSGVCWRPACPLQRWRPDATSTRRFVSAERCGYTRRGPFAGYPDNGLSVSTKSDSRHEPARRRFHPVRSPPRQFRLDRAALTRAGASCKPRSTRTALRPSARQPSGGCAVGGARGMEPTVG